MVAEIQAAQAAHPDIVALSSIGKSYQGRTLWIAKVSDNVATDEPEPEVLFDSLHHAREHLTLEQTLAILRWLTAGYGSDARITNIVDTREVWIVFAVNPDGAEYDLTGSPYRAWRKNRQPNPGSSSIGTDLNRNYGYHWNCCGGSSGSTASSTYRGSGPFSTPEARAIRNFITSRRVGGRQQIKTAITFHTAGAQILWPYGYTKDRRAGRHDVDDQAALAALGRKMAATNGYTPMQSSSLYVTDGDEIDWAYGVEHVFMYTFELYPSHSQVSTNARFYPPDEVIGIQTERNKAAILMLIEAAGCPYAVIGKGRRIADRCSTTSRRTAAGFATRSAATRRPVACGSGPTPPRPRGSSAPRRRARAPWSPATRPVRPPIRTMSTAASRRSARRRSRSRRASAH